MRVNKNREQNRDAKPRRSECQHGIRAVHGHGACASMKNQKKMETAIKDEEERRWASSVKQRKRTMERWKQRSFWILIRGQRTLVKVEKKKPAGEEPEASEKESCLQEGDMKKTKKGRKKAMVEIKDDQGSCGRYWIFSTIRDMEEINSNWTMKPMKSKSMFEAEEPEMFKAEDGRTLVRNQGESSKNQRVQGQWSWGDGLAS